MPYRIVRSSDCPDDRPWAVMGPSKRMGCHPTKEAAERQLAALYANEPGLAEFSSVHVGLILAEHLPGQHSQETHGKGGLGTAQRRVASQEGKGKAAGAATEGDFYRTARDTGMPVDNRGLMRGEPGAHVVRKKGNRTTIAYYDETGKPVGLVSTSGRKIDLVAVRPSMRGKGMGTAMYDAIQDTTDINLYEMIGTSRDFTVAGKAFAEKWLAHRATIEAAA